MTARPHAHAYPHPLLAHVHETHEAVSSIELSPPHPPREETPEYAKAHHFLVVEQDRPCEVCGVRRSTLTDPARNPAGAKDLETHHYPIERSLAAACDPLKVHARFPAVYDEATLMTFVDSPANLVVLCDQHHRSTTAGIHHLLAQDFAILPFLRSGYQIAAASADGAASALAHDELLVADVAADVAPQMKEPS